MTRSRNKSRRKSRNKAFTPREHVNNTSRRPWRCRTGCRTARRTQYSTGRRPVWCTVHHTGRPRFGPPCSRRGRSGRGRHLPRRGSGPLTRPATRRRRTIHPRVPADARSWFLPGCGGGTGNCGVAHGTGLLLSEMRFRCRTPAARLCTAHHYRTGARNRRSRAVRRDGHTAGRCTEHAPATTLSHISHCAVE